MSTARRPPRIYYGWVLVVTLGITETISWGALYYAFSVILEPMERELGWSRALVTGAFSLALLLSGLGAVPVGGWLDRHGARGLMTAGSLLGVVLMLGWATVADPLSFYLVWAAIGLVMAMVLYEPAFAVVAQWFDRERARALTAVTLMAGFSSTIFLPLTSWLVDLQGWRGALVTLAAVLAVGTIPAHALLLRRRPEDLGLLVDGEPRRGRQPRRSVLTRDMPTGVALRDPTFRWLVIAFCLSSIVAFGTAVHLVPILVDRGYDATAAASLAGLVGAAQVLGRLVLGPIGERWPMHLVAAGVLAVQPFALLLLLVVPGTAEVVAFVALFGAAKGALTLIRPSFVADLYGRAHYASIAGVLALAVTITQALAPVALGVAYDRLGGYTPILTALAVIAAVGCLAVLPVRRRAGEAADGQSRPISVS